MDPGLLAFLFGVGVGSVEKDILTCPNCGCDFPIEYAPSIGGERTCPVCQHEIVEDGG